ncbi:hypothetical protein WR25_06619 [Diploscapter pachys]|uniref:Armadillo segment polarity protein n=1 Tax=Diploscapter pachys TaxID=2018661 RepID=A0A2A2LUS7_9BILA|nr:hypothetical protein WR25_06619 [Diploscapter pachys]
MRGETSVMAHRNPASGNHADYMNELHKAFRQRESEYNDVEHRVSRVRAAMFSDWDAGPSTSLATRSSIIETMTEPSRQLKDAVLTLLRYEGTTDMSALSIPDLVQLMADHDEAVVARAVQRVYLLSKEDHTIVTYPNLIEALIAASRSHNLNVQRDAMGALSHISEHRDGPMLIFRSGGLAELIRMLYCPVESVVHYAVTTLRNLLIHVEPVKAQARALDAVQALSPLLLRTNPKLLAQVADSLYFLLLDDPNSKLIFLSLGGPKTLVTIMNTYPDHRKLIYTVIRCIRSLSTCMQNKAALISLGCLPALYHELCRAADERTQTAVLVAMRNLSDAATNEENLTSLVIRLLNLIRESNDVMTACACGILSNLTCNNVRNKQTVISNRGVESLIEAIRRYPDVEDATEPALCALRHCTARHSLAEQAQNDLRLCGSFPILLSLLATLRTPVIKAALGVIRNCALLPANLFELTQELTADGDSVVSLAVDILRRAIKEIRGDPFYEVDGVPMLGVIEGAISALHQLATHPAVASALCDDRGNPQNRGEDGPFLELIVKLMSHEEVANPEDELIQREILGLLYQLSKSPEGARTVQATGVTPYLMDALNSPHKSVATYASGVLKNLENDRPSPYATGAAPTYNGHDDMTSSGWQRDGLEPELFGEMYPVQHAIEGLEHTGGYPIGPSNNNTWYDTDL